MSNSGTKNGRIARNIQSRRERAVVEHSICRVRIATGTREMLAADTQRMVDQSSDSVSVMLQNSLSGILLSQPVQHFLIMFCGALERNPFGGPGQQRLKIGRQLSFVDRPQWDLS